jgi:O-methyltransferase/aklanonic acid methyltransferase
MAERAERGGDSPEAKARVAAAFERMAPTYGSRLPLFDLFGRDLVAEVQLHDGDRVLDIACGRGACLRPACEAVGRSGRVLGVDLSPQMIALTAEELRRDGISNAEVRVGDAEDLEIDDESFDAVLCGFCVPLFSQPRTALAEFRRVLRPSGRFGASTPADRWIDYPWVFDALDEVGVEHEFRRSAQPNPVSAPEGLSAYLGDAGFDQISITRTQRRFVFPDLEALMQWWRAHFLGPVLARMTDDQRHRFREACTRRLANHETADGFELMKGVDITTAHRA